MLSAFSRSLVLAVVLAAPVLAAPPETEQLRVSVTADTERFAEPRAVELTLRANIPGPAPSGWMLKFDWQLNRGGDPGLPGGQNQRRRDGGEGPGLRHQGWLAGTGLFEGHVARWPRHDYSALPVCEASGERSLKASCRGHRLGLIVR